MSRFATHAASCVHDRHTSAFLASTALIGSLFTLPAQAAETPAQAAKAGDQEEIIVNGIRIQDPLELTTASTGLPTGVFVIDHDELERTNFGGDFGSLLRRVPGAMAHNLGQGDTGSSIKMRGFFSSSHGADTAVYIDGMPQNVPSSSINHGMNDMSWLTPDMIQSIDVIKGPFSPFYGDQNRSGAVNITTRSSSENSISASFGAFGMKRGDLVISQELGKIEVLGVADIYDTDGYRDNSGATRGTGFLKGSLREEDAVWALRGVYHHSEWKAPGFLNINGLNNGTLKPTDRDPTAPPLWGDADRSSLVFTRTPTDPNNGWQATGYLEKYKRRRALGVNLTDINVQVDDRWIAGGRGLYNRQFGEQVQVSAGAEIRHDGGDSIHRRWPSAVPGPNYTFNQDLDLLTYGVFAEGQYKPFETLKLLAGVRTDWYDYSIVNRKLPAASLDYSQSVTTPRAGVVWSPIKALDLFANIGQGARSPNQSEISPSGNVGPLGATGGTPFPTLKPPKVKSYDFGGTVHVLDIVDLYFAKYHTLNENEISQISPGVFASVGNVTRDGWEIEANASLTESLTAYASYGKIEQAKINNPAAGTADRLSVPKDTLKGGVGYTTAAPGGSVLLNADTSYISGVPYFAGTPLTLAYFRPYVRYDLRATYRYGKADFTAYATFQPKDFSSEVISSSAAGGLVDPRPKADGGVSIRYRF